MKKITSAMFHGVFWGVVLLPNGSGVAQGAGTVDQRTEARIDALVKRMTLEEKVSLIGGTGFATRAIPRLGIPAVEMADGPVGVRGAGPATAFPSGISMAATFDPPLIKDMAAAAAEEARFFGKNMLLGPCVGVSRHPFGGRNFEGMGEDPFLTSLISSDYIRGVQSQNILASVKHFAVNDQETDRLTVDTIVDERSLFEMHLPPFKAAVDAGVWTVMAAYNKINGHWATENDFLLNQVLKKRWGFKGFVVSDWGATHHTREPAVSGLDLEMPTGDFMNSSLIAMVRAGEIKESIIDDKIRRLLRPMFAVGLLKSTPAKVLPAAQGPASAAHQAIALKVAKQSIVLLKNENRALPIDADQTKSIAVVGPNANFARTGGGGSSEVLPFAAWTPLAGLTDRLKNRSIEIRFAAGAPLPGDEAPIASTHIKPSLDSNEQGLRAEFFESLEPGGTPFLTRLDPRVDFDNDFEVDPRLKHGTFSARWSGFVRAEKPGRYKIATMSDDGIRVFINDTAVINNWTPHATTPDAGEIEIKTAGWHPIRVEYFQTGGHGMARLGWQTPLTDLIEDAVRLAKTSDVALVFAGLGNAIESEARDRGTMSLPDGQDELIKRVAAANPRTIVVLYSGNPLAMGEWIDQVPAVLHAWYPGQAGGLAIADLLLGNTSPSGRLPVSFLKRWEDSPAFGHFPGKNERVEYAEGLFIGYRHFDRVASKPQFAFGHGLTYTMFVYDNMRLIVKDNASAKPSATVEFDLVNTGDRPAAEVAQVYVGEITPAVERPKKELKGFSRVELNPGERRRISIELPPEAFRYYDVLTHEFRADAKSRYRIDIGASSVDIRLTGQMELK